MKLFNLPNTLTLINLLAGCIGVVLVFNYQLDYVPYCVLVSLVADFFDGFAARFTKNATNIGKELDSLADMVSFGFLPGAVLFKLLFQSYEAETIGYPVQEIYVLSAPAFLITLFSALRLAKFNLDTRQSEGFIGLATPASTLFVIGVLLVFLHNTFGLTGIIFWPPFLYGVTIVLSVLMIVELPMFSFKFKTFGWKRNEVRYLFIILSVVLLATLKFAAISAIIILYIIISAALKLLKP